MQTYKTGRTNVALSTTALAVWILNAVLYAVVVCLIFYYVVAPTFEAQDVFTAGTSVFVGLCMSLQAKVAFFHHQWAWPQVFVMALSILGMFVYFLAVSVIFDDYWHIAQAVYASGIYWLFAMFFMPIVAVFIDWFGYYGKLLFCPTDEMLYREFEHHLSFNALQMLTCMRPEPRDISTSERLSEQYGIEHMYPATAHVKPPLPTVDL